MDRLLFAKRRTRPMFQLIANLLSGSMARASMLGKTQGRRYQKYIFREAEKNYNG
jgi:hypothetical protein